MSPYALRGAERVARAVPRVDGWRQPFVGCASEDASYKEWMHFCIRLPGETPGHLLVNVNVTERATSETVARIPRLIALAYLDGWSGAIETFGERDTWAPPGGLAFRLGNNELDWQDGAFRLSIRTRDLSADLAITPVVLPTVASSVSFGPGHSMHWVVVPRLEATGWVRTPRGCVEIDRALAYHDHNWGHFRWGGDLSWEWGFVNPHDASCPWTVVFVRVSDGNRHRTLSQGALLWKGQELVRTFQNREITFELEGIHADARPFTVPAIASLLVPGHASGVPARLSMKATGDGEILRVDFETAAKARVVLPSDVDDFRLVLLNETCGHARMSGSTRAGQFDCKGSAVTEFVRG